jgi:hypothetical protein
MNALRKERHVLFHCFSNWYGAYRRMIRNLRVTRLPDFVHMKARRVAHARNRSLKWLASKARAFAITAVKGRSRSSFRR